MCTIVGLCAHLLIKSVMQLWCPMHKWTWVIAHLLIVVSHLSYPIAAASIGDDAPFERINSFAKLFEGVLDSSSDGRANAERAEIWASGGMCSPQPSARIVLYNRVPKTASTFIKTCIRNLHIPHLTIYSLTAEHGQLKNASYRKSRIQQLCQLVETDAESKYFISGHISHMNFSEPHTCVPQPNVQYVNIIRHPVERLVSQYYYHHSARHATELKKLESLLKTNKFSHSDLSRSSRQLAANFKDVPIDSRISSINKQLSALDKNSTITLDDCVKMLKQKMATNGIVDSVNLGSLPLKYFVSSTRNHELTIDIMSCHIVNAFQVFCV
eukprot:m.649854 g.649854  ORF g.649854 m.649854 type:complete len:327 (+) comp22667_c0_seq8:211-1191(+)